MKSLFINNKDWGATLDVALFVQFGATVAMSKVSNTPKGLLRRT